MNILFINACVRGSHSRTLELCNTYLEPFRKMSGNSVRTLDLSSTILAPLTSSALAHRDALVLQKTWSDPLFQYAREFAAADHIVVGAPYWDLSFPACLKVYLEHIFVCGITFHYVETGSAGLCHAQKLMYISSAGGYLTGSHAGETYLSEVCGMLGVHDFDRFCMEGLDIAGENVPVKMQTAFRKLNEIARFTIAHPITSPDMT